MKKKYKIRQGSIAYYVIGFSRPLSALMVLAAIILALMCCAEVGMSKTEAQWLSTSSNADTEISTKTSDFSEDNAEAKEIIIEEEKTSEIEDFELEEVLEEDEELTVEELIYMRCSEAGIDGDIALAIAKLETGRFTSAAYLNGNNVAGLSKNEKPIVYDSLEEGIDAYIRTLSWYWENGWTTVEEIGKHYCPANYSNWVASVNALLLETKK